MSAEYSRKQFTRAVMISQACSLLGWGEDPKQIVDKVNQLLRGLPREDEFIALSTWMGKCSLIHKLDQEQFPVPSRDNYQVPDLFAIYDFNGRNIPVLIEVKKTSDIKLRPFSNAYYSRLANYANLMHLPLLIAWYIERANIWCLFELERMTRKRTAFHIDFHTATNNSLLGILADDVILTLKKGTQLLFRIRKDPKTVIRDNISGKVNKFAGIMEEIVWVSPQGKQITCSPNMVYRIQDAQEETGLTIDEIDNKFQELQNKLAELQPTLTELDEKKDEITQLEKKRDDLAPVVDSLEQKYSTLNPIVKDLQERQGNLLQQIKKEDLCHFVSLFGILLTEYI